MSTFEPLKAAARRVVHLAVESEEGVTTRSEGSGGLKRVRVFLEE